MKKLVLLLSISVALLLVTNKVQAQKRWGGQFSITAIGGITDQTGFNTFIGIERYAVDHPTSWRFGVNYYKNIKDLDIKKTSVNYGILSTTLFYTVEQLSTENFFVNIGGSPYLGLEAMEKPTVPNGVTVENVTNFIYGINLVPQLEYCIKGNFCILFEPRIGYMRGTEFKKFNYSGNIGIKFYLPY